MFQDDTTGLRFGNFEVLVRPDGSIHELGRGGFGRTLLARHSLLNTRVALKIIDERHARDEAARGRFLKEAREQARLTHPGIARITDCGQVEGQLYYAVELCPDGHLRDLVGKAGPLNVADTFHVLLQAAEALEFSHRNGVVHLDVKPSNLMLVFDRDGHPQVKLIDYGLVQQPEAGAAPGEHDGQPLFSAPFASPEQIRSKPADGRSDIFSLGMTGWYLLTGHNPVEGTVDVVIQERLSPGEYDAALPSQLTGKPRVVLARMIRKNPGDRYDNSADLIADLRGCLKTMPPLAGGWQHRRRSSGALADRFTLEKGTAARQGMVHQAIDRETRQRVKVTLLRSATMSQTVAQYHKVREIMSGMEGSGLLRVLEVREFNEGWAVVEERSAGVSLTEILRSEGAMPLSRYAPLVWQLAAAMDTAFSAGLTNVMLDEAVVDQPSGAGKRGIDWVAAIVRMPLAAGAPGPAATQDGDVTLTGDFTRTGVSGASVQLLARWVYFIIGGKNPPNSSLFSIKEYIAIPGLGDQGNQILARHLCGQSAPSLCQDMLRPLFAAEGLSWEGVGEKIRQARWGTVIQESVEVIEEIETAVTAAEKIVASCEPHASIVPEEVKHCYDAAASVYEAANAARTYQTQLSQGGDRSPSAGQKIVGALREISSQARSSLQQAEAAFRDVAAAVEKAKAEARRREEDMRRREAALAALTEAVRQSEQLAEEANALVGKVFAVTHGFPELQETGRRAEADGSRVGAIVQELPSWLATDQTDVAYLEQAQQQAATGSNELVSLVNGLKSALKQAEKTAGKLRLRAEKVAATAAILTEISSAAAAIAAAAAEKSHHHGLIAGDGSRAVGCLAKAAAAADEAAKYQVQIAVLSADFDKRGSDDPDKIVGEARRLAAECERQAADSARHLREAEHFIAEAERQAQLEAENARARAAAALASVVTQVDREIKRAREAFTRAGQHAEIASAAAAVTRASEAWSATQSKQRQLRQWQAARPPGAETDGDFLQLLAGVARDIASFADNAERAAAEADAAAKEAARVAGERKRQELEANHRRADEERRQREEEARRKAAEEEGRRQAVLAEQREQEEEARIRTGAAAAELRRQEEEARRIVEAEELRREVEAAAQLNLAEEARRRAEADEQRMRDAEEKRRQEAAAEHRRLEAEAKREAAENRRAAEEAARLKQEAEEAARLKQELEAKRKAQAEEMRRQAEVRSQEEQAKRPSKTGATTGVISLPDNSQKSRRGRWPLVAAVAVVITGSAAAGWWAMKENDKPEPSPSPPVPEIVVVKPPPDPTDPPDPPPASLYTTRITFSGDILTKAEVSMKDLVLSGHDPATTAIKDDGIQFKTASGSASRTVSLSCTRKGIKFDPATLVIRGDGDSQQDVLVSRETGSISFIPDKAGFPSFYSQVVFQWAGDSSFVSPGKSEHTVILPQTAEELPTGPWRVSLDDDEPGEGKPGKSGVIVDRRSEGTREIKADQAAEPVTMPDGLPPLLSSVMNWQPSTAPGEERVKEQSLLEMLEKKELPADTAEVRRVISGLARTAAMPVFSYPLYLARRDAEFFVVSPGRKEFLAQMNLGIERLAMAAAIARVLQLPVPSASLNPATGAAPGARILWRTVSDRLIAARDALAGSKLEEVRELHAEINSSLNILSLILHDNWSVPAADIATWAAVWNESTDPCSDVRVQSNGEVTLHFKMSEVSTRTLFIKPTGKGRYSVIMPEGSEPDEKDTFSGSFIPVPQLPAPLAEKLSLPP